MTNIKHQIKNNIALIFGVVLYAFISFLIIFHQHHFYDDEIFNLSKMSWSFGEIFQKIQGYDVHPPLSYLINKALFELFNSFKAILILSVILNISALIYFYKLAEKLLIERHAKILMFIFTFLNGGLLLWTNSVRWYAYWVPLFIVLYTYLLKHKKLQYHNIITVAVLLSVMTYLNYLTFLLLAALCIYFIILHKNDLNSKNIFTFFALYFALSGYQIYVFLTVHLQNRSSQLYDFFNSFLNAAYGIINGGSVFIAEPIFIIFSIFTLIVMVIGFKNLWVEKTVSLQFKQSITLLASVILLMILTGISGRYRNNLALIIPFFFVISSLLAYVKSINIKRIYVFSAIILSIVSTHNLLTRTNTAKNSYNLPLVELNNLISNPQGKLIVTYDPSIYFHFLNNEGGGMRSLI